MGQSAESGKLRDVYLGYRSLLTAGGGTALGGKLVLLGEGGLQALERAAAARIAGAATLLVLDDEREAKTAVREGACDFLVTSLDEALRILKNEIRRGAPVGVCLRASPAAAAREMVERGVQPDLLDAPKQALVRQGGRVVAWAGALRPREFAVTWTAETARLLELMDSAAREALEQPDVERERWLRQSPPVLGRRLAQRRWLPMRAGECSRLIEAVAQSAYAASATVERDGQTVWPKS